MHNRVLFWLIFILFIIIALFLIGQAFLNSDRIIVINADPDTPGFVIDLYGTTTEAIPQVVTKPLKIGTDIGPQEPLEDPPEIIKAIYASSWSAGSTKKMNYLIDLINETELNAIIFDVKDSTGYVTYGTDIPEVYEYGAYELRTPNINRLLKRLHDHDIFAIARISVFQDDRLARARPDLALTSSSTGAVWEDHKGLAWIDAASQEAWEYNVAIAREALDRGFDEVNLDYIRFSSDGNLDDISYPFWDEEKLKIDVLHEFWNYVRGALPDGRISADLFGLATIARDGVGIGQHLEYAFGNFDDIAPMVYPSHYNSGAFGFSKPAEHPYDIVKLSMDEAIARLLVYNESNTGAMTEGEEVDTATQTRFRPWLQDFDLGADYTAELVRDQIQAVYDSTAAHPELLSGWMLWNSSNIYTKGALLAN